MGNQVSDSDNANVNVINPGIDIQKTPDEQTVVSGGTATFTITVTNTGDVDLRDVDVTDANTPDCDRTIGDLASGASHTYSCTASNVTSGFINEAVVSAACIRHCDSVRGR